MDIRKIQATGGSSLSVTLPKKWISRMNLSDKDEIIVNQQKNDDLVIKVKRNGNQAQNETLIVTEENYPNLKGYIFSIYKIGINGLTIKSEDNQLVNKTTIRKLTQKLMGWEVVKEGENYIILQNIFDATVVPVSQPLQQLFAISREMLNDTGKVIIKKNNELAIDIINRDDDADKLCLLIERIYYSVLTGRLSEEELSYSAKEIGFFRDVAIQVERICDHIVKIARVATLDTKGNDGQEFILAITKLTKILSEIENLVISEEVYKTNVLAANINNLKRVSFFSNDNTENYNFNETIIQDSLNRIRSILSDIVEDITDQIIMKQYY